MNEKIREAIKAIKEKLGFDLEPAVEINSWCGDTESGFYTEYDIDMDALNVEIDRFQAELAARATPAQPVGYVLFTGHGDKFSREKPKCEIDYWKPVYLESSRPSPSSVGAAIRALPLPESQATGDSTTDFHGRLFKYTDEEMRAILSEAAALAEQVQGQQVPNLQRITDAIVSMREFYLGMLASSLRNDRADAFDKARHKDITKMVQEIVISELAAAPSIAQDEQKSEAQ